MIAYKVTSIEGSSFVISKFKNFSGFDDEFTRFRSKFDLNYKIGKVTEPKVGKIFCFDDLKYAEEFVKDEFSYRIYKCEVQKSKQRKFMADLGAFSMESILNYWNKYNKVLMGSIIEDAPFLRPMLDHAILCDWVKPIKLIKVKNQLN